MSYFWMFLATSLYLGMTFMFASATSMSDGCLDRLVAILMFGSMWVGLTVAITYGWYLCFAGRLLR